MKKIAALLLVFVMMFALCACGNAGVKNTEEIDNLLYGAWTYRYVDDESGSGLVMSFVFVDGEVAVGSSVFSEAFGTLNLEPDSGTYEIKKNKIVISIEDRDPLEIKYEYSDNNLELWYNGTAMNKVL